MNIQAPTQLSPPQTPLQPPTDPPTLTLPKKSGGRKQPGRHARPQAPARCGYRPSPRSSKSVEQGGTAAGALSAIIRSRRAGSRVRGDRWPHNRVSRARALAGPTHPRRRGGGYTDTYPRVMGIDCAHVRGYELLRGQFPRAGLVSHRAAFKWVARLEQVAADGGWSLNRSE